VTSDRRARRGGRKVPNYRCYSEYELRCGDEVMTVRESIIDTPDDKVSCSENIRQVPSGTDLYKELYLHRSSIEGFSNWIDGRFRLCRTRCKGAARQQLEQLGLVCVDNALVWRANQERLAAQNSPSAAA
jgi:hypothetical protein